METCIPQKRHCLYQTARCHIPAVNTLGNFGSKSEISWLWHKIRVDSVAKVWRNLLRLNMETKDTTEKSLIPTRLYGVTSQWPFFSL